QRQLLEVARDADRPRAVAEVALDLAEDRRHRVAGERNLAVGVEAVDRLDEAERRDLDEVVERLLGALVAASQLTRERQEALDERVARRSVARLDVALEQQLGLARASRRTARAALSRLAHHRARPLHGVGVSVSTRRGTRKLPPRAGSV